MAKKITKLTKAQEKQVDEYYEEWYGIGTCTDPADRARGEKAITELYKLGGKEAPKFYWEPSPYAAVKKICKVFEKDNPSPLKVLNQCWWGQVEAYWISFYLFCRNVLGVEYEEDANKRLDLWAEIAQSNYWWWPYEGVCVISDRPEVIELQTEGVERPRLHSLDGPALKFRDGLAMYAITGIEVEPYVVEEPEKITVEEITNNQNQEMRRILLDRYGLDKYIQDVGAKVIDDDPKIGILYRAELSGDESLNIVKVRNSSPEPDGSFKNYWLRVPPNIETAKAAVAWTFDIKPDKYKLFKET